jgi:glycosyltransferase involved in cell wall biosynthesis
VRNTQPLVSVITTFLNAEAFIQEAVDSVLAQTYENWELLLVDDGSSDASTSIAKMASRNHPGRIFYFEHADHQNRGPSASRNLGLVHAKGRFVAFLDADDIFMPYKLERQAKYLIDRPDVGLTFGTTLFWHWDERYTENDDFIHDLKGHVGNVYAPPDFLTEMLKLEDIHPTNCSMLTRQEVISQIGGFEDDFRMYEDTVFLMKLLFATKVFITNDCTAAYRLHWGSQCHKAQEDGSYHQFKPNAARGRFLRKTFEYMEAHKISDQALRQALRRQLLPYDRPQLYSLVPYALIHRFRWLLNGLIRVVTSFSSAVSSKKIVSMDNDLVADMHQEIELFYSATGREKELAFLKERKAKVYRKNGILR